jgi:hypothetical protein
MSIVYQALISLALIVGAYLYGRHDGKSLAEGETAIAERIADKAAQASREAAAKAIAGITVRHTTIQNQLEREVRNVPVYTDPGCRVTPDGLRHLNAALSGTSGQEPSDPELPASGATR